MNKHRQRAFEFSANSTTSGVSRLERRVERNAAPAPRVFYTPYAHDLMWWLIHHCKKEVGWLGLVDRVGNDFLITDLYVPEQIVHGTETDISAEAMGALAYEIINAGKDPGKLYYWGHSHVDMGVSPSSQDETQIDEYLETCERFIRGIYNKKGQSKVDVFERDANVVYQCVENRVVSPGLNAEQIAAWTALVANNVKEPARPPQFNNWADTKGVYGGERSVFGSNFEKSARGPDGRFTKKDDRRITSKDEDRGTAYDDLMGFDYI